ncbi:TPR-like protein [Eremomyces bilateralis CBS 781.70]|uniref:TPR-like protein n=1 Tax=Eremomyces bilateralis CBS 781.70 TaxID=1392243 RepID=A0A6G1G0F1_9PEZI|nr:TPR-like protein [Eremomyces bilateralis CBS 781.70]KAF1811400.1 TPR-like protein [Eremomyces bilateralis CBS 781.70]
MDNQAFEGFQMDYTFSEPDTSRLTLAEEHYYLNPEVQSDAYTALGPNFDFHSQHLAPNFSDFPIVHEGVVPAEEYENEYPEDFQNQGDERTAYESSDSETSSGVEDEILPDFDANDPVGDPNYPSSSASASPSPDESEESEREIQEAIGGLARGNKRGRPAGRGRSRGRPPGAGRGRGRGRGGWRAVLKKKAEEEGWSDDELFRKPKRQKKTEKPRGRQKGVRAGPRKTAEPSMEFRRLQSIATKAYIDQKFEIALKYARDAVKENPEIYAAHSLLSEILRLMGNKAESVTVLIAGAHTARDPQIWLDAAGRVLELAEDDKPRQKQALYCLSQAIGLDPNAIEPRWEKVKLLEEIGKKGSKTIQNECVIILKTQPRHWDALDTLAEIALQNNEIPEVKKAIKFYDAAFEKAMSEEEGEEEEFSFGQLNSYLDLIERTGDYMVAISKLKSLSRWLVDRENETYWDWEKTDAEWDIDDKRRNRVREFVPGQYPKDSYGELLPIELRAKLGIFRLKLGPEYLDEAMQHFRLILDFGVDKYGLDPDLQAVYVTVGDLLKQEGDTLKEAENMSKAKEMFETAVDFYERVNNLDEDPDANLLTSLAHCYKATDRLDEAEQCYRRNLDVIGYSMQARIQLYVFYTEIEEREKASQVMDEIDKMRVARDGVRKKYSGPYRPALRPRFIHKGMPTRQRQRRTLRHASREGASPPRIVMDHLWNNLRALQARVDDNDPDAIVSWLEIAEALIQGFRSCADMWPSRDRINRFGGYSRQSLELQGKTPSQDVLKSQSAAINAKKQRRRPITYWGTEGLWNFADLHADFHGVSFTDWAHLFCQYALLLAKSGEIDEAKNAFEEVEDAIVFHFDEDIQRIRNVALLSYNLYINDEEGILNTARWFIKTNPYGRELYKMMACVARQYVGRRTWFSSGPTQKFVMRMVKMQDFALLTPENREKYDFSNAERVRWQSMIDGNMNSEKQIGADALPKLKEIDPSLLTLYAHTLSENRHISGLHYYFRAYCLRPNDPVINLSIASNFFQSSIKRRSDNRHYQILQGMAFMQRYYQIRTAVGAPAIHRQEAEFNIGRAFHQFGMWSMAIQAYQKSLELEEEVQREMAETDSTEEFTKEAAFSLVHIFGLTGNLELAREITEKYLVI